MTTETPHPVRLEQDCNLEWKREMDFVWRKIGKTISANLCLGIQRRF